nr:hypothetical protein Iba_scaffold2300CG1250 [Ipomoea batatas]
MTATTPPPRDGIDPSYTTADAPSPTILSWLNPSVADLISLSDHLWGTLFPWSSRKGSKLVSNSTAKKECSGRPMNPSERLKEVASEVIKKANPSPNEQEGVFWAWVRAMEVLEKLASPMSVILGEENDGVMEIAGEVKMEKKRRRTQARLMGDNPIQKRVGGEGSNKLKC